MDSREDKDDEEEEDEESSEEEGGESEPNASHASDSDFKREESAIPRRSRRASSHPSDTESNHSSPTKKGGKHLVVEIEDVNFNLGNINSYEPFPDPGGEVPMCEDEPSHLGGEDCGITDRITCHSLHTRHRIAFTTHNTYTHDIHCIHHSIPICF